MNEAWYEVSTAPTEEPVTRAELSLWSKVDSSDDNDILDSLIKAARTYSETYTRRGFVTQTVKAYFPCFSNLMILNRSPISAITSIQYYDLDNSLQTLATTVYDANLKKEPGEITIGYNQTWPETYDKPNAVIVTMTVGYGAASAVPEEIKTAIKFIAEHWYDTRTDVAIGSQVNKIPMTSEAILNNYRVWIYK